jgi:putative colanic acid biosynthesis acetyltransferase WcaF
MYNKDTITGPSFSLKNRLARSIWGLISFFFFEYSPKPLHSWRVFILRICGAKVGKGVHIYPKVKIWAPWNLILGDRCGIANGATLYSQGKIFVGKFAVISQGVYICTGTHDYTNPGFPLITKPVVIGDNTWVAADTFVHPGVTLGEGCVVGARSVVTKDMPGWMVCSGFPCIPIKKRVTEETKQKFLKLNVR